MKTVTVFGSAKCKIGTPEYELAYRIGRGVGSLGLMLCNGGYGGVMEASAKGAHEKNGHTIGVTLSNLSKVGWARGANMFIREEIPSASLWERLQKLIQLGDSYVCLQGGTGTLLELAVVSELLMKGMIEHCPLLIYEPYWKPLIELLRKEIDAPDPRFPVDSESNTDSLFSLFNTAEEAVKILRSYTQP